MSQPAIAFRLVSKTTLSSETIKINSKDEFQQGSGPLVNMSVDANGNYIVTVLSYLPKAPKGGFKTVKVSEGVEVLSLGLLDLEDKVLLTYNGVKVITTTDRNKNRQLVDCRDFKFEYDCTEGATEFQLCHFKFTYSLINDTDSVDSILVRDENLDPETSRGTVTTPADGE